MATGLFFLALSILSMTAFGLIMKFSQEKGYSVLSVGATNYIVAAVTASLFMSPRQLAAVRPGLWWLSAAGGLGYLATYLLLAYALRRRGIAVPMAATQVAMALPVILSVWVWHERPNLLQVVGIALSVLAILLLAPHNPGPVRLPWWACLVVPGIFLLSGGTRVAQKALTEIAPTSQQPALALLWFGAAGLASLAMYGFTGLPASPGEWATGACLGWVNLGSLVFFLRALKLIPGVVAFPAASCLSLALTSAAAVLVWRESLGRRGAFGILAALIAATLVRAG